MYLLLILFFGSLVGIIFMIGRRLAMLQNGEMLYRDETLDDSYLEEWKHSTVRSFKKYSYIGLVATVRFYVHLSDFLKKRYGIMKIKIKNMHSKKLNVGEIEKIEVSKFLKMISEYKYKIRKIRRQIKEEEDL